MTEKARITVTKNGPYLVTGGVPLIRMRIETDNYEDPLKWREVERYPLQDSYILCRCGNSSNKPYCDNSHINNEFDGTETFDNEPYLENVKEFSGPELTLTDKKELCVSASFCVREGGIWNLVVHSDRPGFKEIAIEEAANCPSGRLIVWDKQGNSIEPSYEPSIVVTEHEDGLRGPLWIRGEIEIVTSNGIIYEKRNHVTLCRCGKSNNKSLCDRSHFENS